MVLVLGKEGQYHQASGILEGWGCCVKESGLECTSKIVANGRIPSAPIIAPVPICHQSARGCVCVWVQNLVLLCRVAFSALSCDNVSGGVYLCLFCFSIFMFNFTPVSCTLPSIKLGTAQTVVEAGFDFPP